MMKEILKKIPNIFKKEATNENYEEYENYVNIDLPRGTDINPRLSKREIDFMNKEMARLDKMALDYINKEWEEKCEINRAYCGLTDEEERALHLGKAVSVKTESGKVKKLGWIPMGGFAELGWVK